MVYRSRASAHHLRRLRPVAWAAVIFKPSIGCCEFVPRNVPSAKGIHHLAEARAPLHHLHVFLTQAGCSEPRFTPSVVITLFLISLTSFFYKFVHERLVSPSSPKNVPYTALLPRAGGRCHSFSHLRQHRRSWRFTTRLYRTSVRWMST